MRRIDYDGIISTWAGLNAEFMEPYGCAISPLDNALFVVDRSGNQVFTVDPFTANVSSLAGTGYAGASGDDGHATAAELNAPTSVAVSADGSIVFIADTDNSVIRAVALDNNTIYLVAVSDGRV